MKKLSITKTIIVLASIGVMTACGAVGTTDTASTSDYDTEKAASTEIRDLGTEEYLITEIDSVSTDEEKQMKYIHFLEKVLTDDIASAYPSVRDVSVALTVKDSNVTLIDAEEAMQVNILLDLEEELTEDNIVEIAEAVATATGSGTDNITIVDTDGNVLYVRSEALPENDI